MASLEVADRTQSGPAAAIVRHRLHKSSMFMSRASGQKRPAFAGDMQRLTAVVALLLLLNVSAHACGFHLQVKNSLQVSYPGAVEVGVAVMVSRQLGLLPSALGVPSRKEIEFVEVMADLEHLRSRLTGKNTVAAPEFRTNGFSVLLVGSALWSSYRMTPAGVLARYHISGPVEGQPVLVTHHAVLRALLSGEMTLLSAYEHKLLVHSGNATSIIQRALETAFRRKPDSTSARY